MMDRTNNEKSQYPIDCPRCGCKDQIYVECVPYRVQDIYAVRCGVCDLFVCAPRSWGSRPQQHVVDLWNSAAYTPPAQPAMDEKLYHAAINCPHEITRERIILDFDERQPGHNALNQLGRRLDAAAKLLTAQPADNSPLLWTHPTPDAEVPSIPSPNENLTFQFGASSQPVDRVLTDILQPDAYLPDGSINPKYTQPAERKPLTNSQIAEVAEKAGVYDDMTMALLGLVTKFTRAIEAAHGIKGES